MAARKWSGPNRITLFVNLQISRTSQPLGRGGSWGCKPYLLHDLWLQGGSGPLGEALGGRPPAWVKGPGVVLLHVEAALLTPTFLPWPHTLLPTPRSSLTWTLRGHSQLSAKASSDWQRPVREHAQLWLKKHCLEWTMHWRKHFPSEAVRAARSWESPFCWEGPCYAFTLGLWGRQKDIPVHGGTHITFCPGVVGLKPAHCTPVEKNNQWIWFF